MTVQRVNPPSLTGQATEMKNQNWHNPAEEAVAPPDALPSTNDAIANLNDNAQSLKDFEEWAKVENQRIAEMLEIAAAAYQKVDNEYGNALDNPERLAAIEAISIPSPQTPPPEIPAPASTPRLLDASGYSDVKKTQTDLNAPDAGVTLKNALLYWYAASNRVENNKPKPPPGDWEGDAADAAYARMTKFGSWLDQLSNAWDDLCEAAAKILEAHEKAKGAHQPIYDEYMQLEARMQELNDVLKNMTSHPGAVRAQRELEEIVRRMAELQKQSEEVRQDYASGATFSPVRPADPPFKAESSTPAGAGGGGQGSGGGDQPKGDAAAMAQKMGESLGTAQQGQGAGQGGGSGGGSQGGGSPSGGEGSGGGAGGSEGGASPTSSPRLPTDPSLRPAAGAGSGGGSGAGGGGAGTAPLSPAVSAETVAPAPPMPVAAGQAAPAAAAGGMAGGMGGMAPMHGAQGAQQGKEKRRDPRTAPDEELYVEDRPWTEGVVGNRRRREVNEGRPLERDDDQDDDE